MATTDTTRQNGMLADARATLLKSLKPLALILAAGTMLTSISPAQADPAIIKTMTFQATGGAAPIHVISTDKKTWNALKPGLLQFHGTMNIEARYRGRIMSVGAALGTCGPNTCSPGAFTFLQSAGDNKTWSGQKNMAISTDKFGPTKPGHVSVLPYGDAIIAKCNQHLAADGPTRSHSFTHTFHATFLAHSRKSKYVNEGGTGAPTAATLAASAQHAVSDSFTVPVVCDPVVKSPAGGVAAEQPANLSVGSIELFRTTYAHANSQPNPATQCKKARWLVRLNTNKAGPVKFKLWLKNGDAPMTSKVIDGWASFDGDSKYKAEYAEWTEVTKTSVVQGKAEDMTNAIGQSTEWKDITLRCTGIAGGGLADVPNTSNPDNGINPVPLKVTGELTLADKDGAPKDKPRLGAAVFKIWATRPGSTSYRLTCSGGRNWEGTLPTFKVADKKYQAVGLQNFQIDKTEQIGCALRSTSLPKDPVIAVATKLFELIKRNPNIGGANTEAGTPRPPAAKPDPVRPATLVDQARPQKPNLQKPGIKVAPVRLSCAGGKVSGATCFCPAGTQKVQAAPNAFRCVKQIARPEGLTRPAARLPAPKAVQRQTFRPAPREVFRPTQRQTAAPQRPARFMR